MSENHLFLLTIILYSSLFLLGNTNFKILNLRADIKLFFCLFFSPSNLAFCIGFFLRGVRSFPRRWLLSFTFFFHLLFILEIKAHIVALLSVKRSLFGSHKVLNSITIYLIFRLWGRTAGRIRTRWGGRWRMLDPNTMKSGFVRHFSC